MSGQAQGTSFSSTFNLGVTAGHEPDAPPYTAEEERWLKDAYGGEYHFLASYQLSIFKEDDREEGRRIARGLVERDKGNSAPD